MNWGLESKSKRKSCLCSNPSIDFGACPQFIHTFIDRAYKGTGHLNSADVTGHLRERPHMWDGRVRFLIDSTFRKHPGGGRAMRYWDNRPPSYRAIL